MNRVQAIVVGLLVWMISVTVSASGVSDEPTITKEDVIDELFNLKMQVELLQSIQTVSVDCDADPNALQNTINAAPNIGVNIMLSGTCNPINVTQDNINIDGQGIATIFNNGSAIASVSTFSASDLILNNLTLTDSGVSGLNLFIENTDVTLQNVTGTGGGAAIVIDNSYVQVLGNVSLDNVFIAALGSSVDAKPASVFNVLGYIGVTGASLFINNQLNVTFFQLIQGAKAAIQVGALNATGGLLITDNSFLALANGSIAGNVQVSNGGVVNLANTVVFNPSTQFSVITNSVVNWQSGVNILANGFSCHSNGVALVDSDPTLDLCESNGL